MSKAPLVALEELNVGNVVERRSRKERRRPPLQGSPWRGHLKMSRRQGGRDLGEETSQWWAGRNSMCVRFSEGDWGSERKGSKRSSLEGSLWLDRKGTAGHKEELRLLQVQQEAIASRR